MDQSAGSRPARENIMRIINRASLSAFALVLGASSLAKAQDNECGDVAAMVRQAYPGAVAESGRLMRVGDRTLTLPVEGSIDPHAIVCRRWRGRPGLLLVAVPLIAQVRSDGTSGDLDVLVVDQTTGTPRQRLRVPNAMDDDAIRLSGISFDTAPYRLGPDRLAFGVKREWAGSSRPNPFSETTLSLYEVRGRDLSPVLQDVVVFRSVGEWGLSCAGETVLTERILRMIPGLRGQDISVLDRRTHSTSGEDKSGECASTDRTETPRTIVLPFDGERYLVPRSLERD